MQAIRNQDWTAKPVRRRVALAAALIAIAWPGAAAVACDELIAETHAAASADNASRVEALVTEAEGRGCSAEQRRAIGREAALTFYRRAYNGAMSGPEQQGLIRKALTLGRPWEVVANVGDIELDAGQFEKAATLYQEALDDLRDDKANPAAPPREVIAGLVKKAEQARLLSPVYVKRVDRDGSPSGLACPTFRGFTATKTAVPIEFVYRETTFTDKGQAAVADMFDYLSRQGSPDVALIGHTDPRGGDAYNLDLSKRRAAAVATYLQGKGYAGKISTGGRGKAERFQADDPGRYSEEQLFQLDRRVELDRKSMGKSCKVAAH